MNTTTFAMAVIIVGMILFISNKLNLGLGHLPGDLFFEGRGWSLWVPAVSCMIISIIVSAIIKLLGR